MKDSSLLRLCFTLLSPTWGMHQYTAALANRMHEAGHQVHVVTTVHAPRSAYAPGVTLHAAVATRNTGFSPDGLRPRDLSRVLRGIKELLPDVVHFTGPHLWNPWLVRSLELAGTATAHTLHDLRPHSGAAYGRLLYLWNGCVRRRAGHLLVHGRLHRERLLAQGVAATRVTSIPLTHLCVGYHTEQLLRGRASAERSAYGAVDSPIVHEPWALFIGRLEKYKGLHVLVEAARHLDGGNTRIVIAGQGPELKSLARAQLAVDNVQVRAGFVGDQEAVDLFRRCGVVVLPYIEASQSALVAAAYFFHKPVIVTRAGALPEYVVDGVTGWVVPPRDSTALANVLNDALSNPDRRTSMGDAGRACYEQWRAEEEVALRHMYESLSGRTTHPLRENAGVVE
jgi:starch synthase